MATKSSRGGAFRKSIPPVDEQALLSVLEHRVKSAGLQAAFRFGVYDYIPRSHAADAAGLADNCDLLDKARAQTTCRVSITPDLPGSCLCACSRGQSSHPEKHSGAALPATSGPQQFCPVRRPPCWKACSEHWDHALPSSTLERQWGEAWACSCKPKPTIMFPGCSRPNTSALRSSWERCKHSSTS